LTRLGHSGRIRVTTLVDVRWVLAQEHNPLAMKSCFFDELIRINAAEARNLSDGEL